MTYGQFMETREVTNDYIGLKLFPNPIINGIDRTTQQTIEGNVKLLKQIVYKRIDPEVELIDEEAIELAIEHSGGIIRQFIKILSHAGRRVRRLKGTKISVNDVDYGADKVRQELEASLIGTEKIALLEEVRTTHKPSTKDRNLLIECLLANQILAFRNEPTWYSINPLIEKTIEVYASTNTKNE
jgi:DNA polymerase III delta prime subunit